MKHNTKDLREKNAKLWEKMKSLIAKAKEEGRELTAEETGQWDELSDEHTVREAEIARLEKMNDLEAQEAERTSQEAQEAGESEDELTEKKELHKNAFEKYLRTGMRSLNAAEVEVMGEHRAQSAGTDSEGGFTVPEGFSNELEMALKAFGGMREAARIVPTATGNDLPWPTNDDTGNVGAILAENTQVSEQDATFGSITIEAFMYTSKLIRVSLQLLQDSAFPMDSFLIEKLVERIGRIQNTHFTIGTGSGQPNGVMVAAQSGATAAANNAVSFDDILDLKHSVDPAYRAAPGARFMLNDSTLKAIKKLSIGSSDARPLWQPSFIQGEPALIDGSPYTINQDVASIGAGNDFMAFGDFNKYIIRDVTGTQILRLQERYADFLQIGFLGFRRGDGELIDAAQGPIKTLRNPTT